MSTVSQNLLSPELMAQLERLELVSRKIFRGRMKGERRSPRKGQSVEFADFRGYVPGDDLRFIDWNTYARLDRLFLKIFFEEEDLHFYALIDASPSMGFGTPTKLQYAKKLAAALGFVGLVRADRVRIETLGQQPPFVGGEDAGHHVERDQALRAAFGAVDQERDAETAEQHRRLIVLLAQPVGRQALEPSRELLIGRARATVGRQHLVEGRRSGHRSPAPKERLLW